MKNHHEVGHFKTRLMILSLSLVAVAVMAGESIAATTCSTCHGMPPLDSVDGTRVPSTGAFKGSHQKHVSPGAVSADCVVCHSAAAGYDMKHSATSGNVIGISASINGGTYSKGTSFSQSATPVMGSCSNVSCHADPYSASTIPTPDWGTPSGCSACHSSNPIGATGPNTGSHSITGHNAACTSCHATDTSATTTPSTGHADGDIDVTNGYPATAKHAAGTYTGTCSTATCHPNVYGTGTVTTPVWGTTGNNCSACHSVAIGTNGPATGAHLKHAGVACTVCHAAGTTSATAPSAGNGHIDGNVDVFYFSYPANVAKHAAGSGYGACATANCHSNGSGTFTSPNWGGTSTGCTFCHPTLSAGHNIHVNTLLSEISFYSYTANKSVGTTYKFGCGNCHPVGISKHMDTFVDVDLVAAAAGGSIKFLNGAGAGINGSKQCSNVYCHSNGFKPGASYTFATTPAWGGAFAGDRCAACHGNSPNSSIVGSAAHSAHVVGVHVDDIFNGVSKKLPISGAAAVNAAHGRNNRSTTINCNVCHAATVSTFANDNNTACNSCHNGTYAPLKNSGNLIGNSANHVNGKVDITFINQKIATKAQVANSAFGAYTAAASGGWSRNRTFKNLTSAYDVTKVALAAAASYSQAVGCQNVACHSNITVKWTDSVSCTSCHTRLK